MQEAVKRIMERAKADPTFFHALVFNPEKILSELNELGRYEKAAILAINPENIFIEIASCAAPCESTEEKCDMTCRNSCIGTCDNTCPRTAV